MATTNPSYQIPNGDDPTKPFTFININNSIKLTATNYLSWKHQVEAILIGHDLYKYVDGTLPAPLTTITAAHVIKANPEFVFWTRQDKLLFGALIGTLSQPLVPLVSRANTTKDIWEILAKTYATPSRGHIKQLKDKFHQTSKGSYTITEYMQSIKACVDQLAALGKTIDHEYIIDRILLGLGDDTSYSPVIDAVNARDSPIFFEDLHEKLINRELTIQQTQQQASSLPVTAFAAAARPHTKSFGRSMSPGILPTPGTPANKQSRPFLGKCQWCREQGHFISQCPVFRQQCPNVVPPNQRSSSSFKSTGVVSKPSSMQAHAANLQSLPSPWLLDSGASHHVTADLHNLSLHAHYDGTEELIIGDGTGSSQWDISLPRSG